MQYMLDIGMKRAGDIVDDSPATGIHRSEDIVENIGDIRIK